MLRDLKEGDEEVEEVADVGISAETLSSSELTDLLVDSLDIGLVVAALSGALLRSNHIGNHHMAAFGSVGKTVPHELWSKAQPIVDAAVAVPGRFTPASPLTSADKRRFFVRCRYVRSV